MYRVKITERVGAQLCRTQIHYFCGEFTEKTHQQWDKFAKNAPYLVVEILPDSFNKQGGKDEK